MRLLYQNFTARQEFSFQVSLLCSPRVKQYMIESYKVCSKCQISKPIESFRLRGNGKRRNECSECLKAHSKQWYNANKEYVKNFNSQPEKKMKVRARQRERYQTEPEFKEASRESNRKLVRTEAYKIARREYIAKWTAIPRNRITRVLRGRLSMSLKGLTKSAKTETLIGCSFEECRAYIESQFSIEMTWENYGEWHIDHIIPCAHFDLADPYQQRLCFNYLNLQPLWAKENLSKGRLLPDVYCETLQKLKSVVKL
jgi:hypothetical protein